MDQPIHSILYPFAIDDSLGTLAEETNYSQHVEQMIKQILFTNPGERVNRPDLGCGLPRMVFAPNSDVTANMTQVMITQSLEKWIGNLIEVLDVKAIANDSTLQINLVYILRARQEHRYLNLEVTL